MAEVSLRVGDRRVDSIQEFRVIRSLNDAISTASFGIFVDQAREDVYKDAVHTPLSIYIGDTQIFNGYIASLTTSGDSTGGTKYEVELASTTMDYFDSQFEETLEFAEGRSVGSIITRLVGSIQTENNASEVLAQNITSARTLPIADSAGRFISNLCDDYNGTLTDNEKGELVVWSLPDNAPVVASIGRILSYDRSINYRQRFARTVVLTETDEDDEQVKGEYTDSGRAGRNRVRVIDKSTGLNGITAREYARFASRRLSGNGVSLTVVVSGFQNADGNVWRRGDTYLFSFDGYQDRFVIAQTIFIGTASGVGNTTELTLVPLDSFINLSRYEGSENTEN